MVCMDYMITGLIDTKTAANILGISRSTLENMRYAGNGPAHIEIGRSVKYRPEAIDEFIDRNTVPPKTSDEEP